MLGKSISRTCPCKRNTVSARRLLTTAIAALFAGGEALALPVGPQVVNGTANIAQVGNALTINNSAGAILNWQKFSIGADELVRFNQPSAASSVLNRVLAADPSVIYGQLSSNGKVWLINPAGILVGAGAKIDTAGFIASTLGVSNSDFLAGKLNFQTDGSAGGVINQGEITTPLGGNVYLIGSDVTNQGIITTPQGETILAAGASVSLVDTATPGVKVEITGVEGQVTNLGQITAEAGRIGMAGVLVRNSGQLNASSVVNQGGRIFLKASQDTYVDGNGRMLTTGTQGGSVEILGQRVALTDQAQVDASGEQGGGQILVGGDYQGKNQNIQNAQVTYVGQNAQLKANATHTGAGGKVIVWSDDTTRAYGSIEAKGGPNGAGKGNEGGFIETSGKRYLDVAGIKVDTRAADGSAGWWLLDPTDITITHSLTPVNPGLTVSGDTSTIADIDIFNAIDTTNVSISTVSAGSGAGNITVYGSADYGGAAVITNNSGFQRYLSFQAEGNFAAHYGSVMAGVCSTCKLELNISAGGSIVLAGAVKTYGGSIALSANSGITIGDGINTIAGTFGLNARADGAAGGTQTYDTAGYGGRILANSDANADGVGIFRMEYGAFIGTSNVTHLLDASGNIPATFAQNGSGGLAVGIVASDIDIKNTATIKLNYDTYGGVIAYGGGGDIGFHSTSSGAIGLGTYGGGAFTLDNTELARIIMPGAGSANCGTGQEGCRIWIGSPTALTDPLAGAIPVATQNIVADAANFTLNGATLVAKRVHLSTTGTINDNGALGAQAGHLSLIAGAGIGTAGGDGFEYYGNSLVLSSANGNIKVTSVASADLALRRATAPNGTVEIDAAGTVYLLPYFSGQSETVYGGFALQSLGDIVLAGSGTTHTVYGAFGTFTESPPTGASIQGLGYGAQILLSAQGNVNTWYGSVIRGSLGSPTDIVIGSAYGALWLTGGVRSYGGDIVLQGNGIEIGNPGAMSAAEGTGLNARADGIGPGSSVTTADIAEGGRIRVSAGTGTLTINPYGGMHTSNTGHLLQADGTLDDAGIYGGVAIGINAGDIEIGYGGGIRATYVSGGAGYGGGDIVILTDASQIRLGDYTTYGGTLTLDNAELSRLLVTTSGNCASGNLGCRLWIGATGSINDPLVGATSATTASIVANNADFTFNGTTSTAKRVHFSTTGTIDDAGSGSSYFGAKSLFLNLTAQGGIGTSDVTDGFNFAGDILAISSAYGSASVTHVSPGTLVLRSIDAPSGGASLDSLYGGIALIPLFAGQGIAAGGNASLSAYGDIVFAYGGQVFAAVGGGAGFGTFSQAASGQPGLNVSGDFSAVAGGDIRFGGGTIPYYQIGNNLALTGTNIEIVDTKLRATGTATLDASQSIVIRGATTSAWVGSVGAMTVDAGSLSIYGGSAVDPNADYFAFTGDIYAALITQGGSQSIDVSGGTVLLQAGNANTGYGGGMAGIFGSGAVQTIKAQSIVLNGGSGQSDAASIFSSGNQILTIYGGQLALSAGGASTGNVAEVVAHGDQTIQFYGGGAITLTGGSAGVDNRAEIGAETGNQWIGSVYGAKPTIVLTGGSGGGSFDHENDAGIHLDDNTNVSGTQTVYAASISIYGGNAAYGGAGFGLEQSGIGSYYVDGNLYMQGGSSSASDPLASAAYIGADAYGAHIMLDIGGSLTMIGGTGTSSPVIIGSLNGVAEVSANIAGAFTMTAGGSAVRIGSNAGTGLGGADILINAGGAVTLTSSATQSASIGSYNSDAMTSSIRAYGATVSLDGTAGGKVGVGIRDLAASGDSVAVIATGGNLSVTGYGGIGAPNNAADVVVAAYGGQLIVDGNAANGVGISGDTLAVYGQSGISITDTNLAAYGSMIVESPGDMSIVAAERATGLNQMMVGGTQTVIAGGNLSMQAANSGNNLRSYIYSYGGTQVVDVGGTLTLQGGTGGNNNRAYALVDTASSGTQVVDAGNIALLAGGGAGGYNNGAQIVNNGTGNQNITLHATGATFQLSGGNGTGVYGGPPDACSDGLGGTLASCANLIASNVALVQARGTNQSIDFVYGGSLTLTGGSGGNNNQAVIYHSGTGIQTISGGASMTLTAGSGGVYIRDLDYLLGNHAQVTTNGIQVIDADSISLTGGASGAARAQIFAGMNSQTITATGNVSLYGGATNLVSSYYGGALETSSYFLRNAAGALIRGNSSTLHNISLDVAGNLSLTGGSGNGGIAFIGNWGGPVDFLGTVGGSTTLTGNTGGAVIGSAVSATTPSNLNVIDLTTAGMLALVGGDNAAYGSAAIGSRYDAVALSIDAASVQLTAASAGDARMGTTYGGSVGTPGSIDVVSYGGITLTTGGGGGAARIGIGGGVGTISVVSTAGAIAESAGSAIYGGEISLTSAGDLSLLGTATAGNSTLTAISGGSIYGGALAGASGLTLTADGNVAIASGSLASASGYIDILAGATYGGNVTIGAVPISANGSIDIVAIAGAAGTGAVAWGGPNTSATGTFYVVAGENVTANGSVTAGAGINVYSGAMSYGTANGYGGNMTSNASFVGGTGMVIQAFGGSRYGGSITTSTGFGASAGSIFIAGEGDVSLVGNIGTASTASNTLKAGYNGSAFVGQHNLAISSTTAYGTNIIAEASGAVSGTFYGASTLLLDSVYGGVASGKAIVAQVLGPVATGITGIVESSATYGGIQLVSTGVAPSTVNLTDQSLNNSTAAFQHYGDLFIGTGTTLNLWAHDVALLGTTNIQFDGVSGGISVPTDGSVLIGANGNLAFNGTSLFFGGSAGLTAGGNLTLAGGSALNGENLNATAAGNISLVGSSISAQEKVALTAYGAGGISLSGTSSVSAGDWDSNAPMLSLAAYAGPVNVTNSDLWSEGPLSIWTVGAASFNGADVTTGSYDGGLLSVAASGDVTLAGGSSLHGEFLAIVTNGGISLAGGSEVGAYEDATLTANGAAGISFNASYAHSDNESLALIAPAGPITITNGSELWAGWNLALNSGGALLVDASDVDSDNLLSVSASGVTVSNNGWMHGEFLNVDSGGALSVVYGSEIGAYQDVNVTAANITFHGGSGVHTDDTNLYLSSATDIRVNEGSWVQAGDSIFMTLSGPASTLYVNEADGMTTSTIEAGSPETIHIDFPARTSGNGIIVDGAPFDPLKTTGSGFFANGSRATEGSGLVIVGSASTIVPPVVNDVVNSVNQSTGSSATDTPTTGDLPPVTTGGSTTGPTGSTTQTTGGGEGSFGEDTGGSTTEGSQTAAQGDEKQDEKKDDKEKKDAKGEEGKDGKKDEGKGGGKKVAQCS